MARKNRESPLPEPFVPVENRPCALCGRLLARPMDRHHLVPSSQGGRNGPKISVHRICHQFLHATYTDKELAKRLSTVKLLLAEPLVQAFVAWVCKRPNDYTDVSYRSKRRRS